jgi:hypothetical protein
LLETPLHSPSNGGFHHEVSKPPDPFLFIIDCGTCVNVVFWCRDWEDTFERFFGTWNVENPFTGPCKRPDAVARHREGGIPFKKFRQLPPDAKAGEEIPPFGLAFLRRCLPSCCE